MKQTSHRLLSLLMAFVLMLSLAPGALAAGTVTIPITGKTSLKINETATYSLPTSVGGMAISYRSYQWELGTVNEPYLSITTSKTSSTCTVKAKKAGRAELFCYVTDALGTRHLASTTIVITAGQGTTSDGATMTITPSTVNVKVGEKFTTKATISNTNKTGYKFSWNYVGDFNCIVARGDSKDDVRTSTQEWEALSPGERYITCSASQNPTGAGELLNNRIRVVVTEAEPTTPPTLKGNGKGTDGYTVAPNENLTLDVTNLPTSSSNYEFKWDVDKALNQSIQSNGTRLVVSCGTAGSYPVSCHITGPNGYDQTAKATVVVSNSVTPTTPVISLDWDKLSGKVGDDITVTAKVTNVPTDGTYRFHWESSDHSVLQPENESSTMNANGTNTMAYTIKGSGEVSISVELQKSNGSVVTRTNKYVNVTATATDGTFRLANSSGSTISSLSLNATGNSTDDTRFVYARDVDSATAEYIVWTVADSSIAGIYDHTDIRWDPARIVTTGAHLSTGYPGVGVIPLKAGNTTLTAQLTDINGKNIGSAKSISITVSDGTVTSAPFQFINGSGNELSRVSLSKTNVYTGVYAKMNVNVGRNATIEWTVTDDSIAEIFIRATEDYKDARKTVTTTASSLTGWPAVNVVGWKEGSTTLSAALYENGRQVGSTVTIPVVVGSGTASVLSVSPSSLSLGTNTSNSSGTLTAYLSNSVSGSLRDYTVRWTSSNTNVAYFPSSVSTTSDRSTAETTFGSSYSSPITVYAGNTNGTATITARLYRGNTAVSGEVVSRTVTVGNNSSFSVSATVYSDSRNYYLSEKDDYNASSILTQIRNKLPSNDSIDSIRFSSVTSTYGDLSASRNTDYYYYSSSSSSGSYNLNNVYFTPSTSRSGTASFSCTVYTTNRNTYSCTINIKVVTGSTKDFTVSATVESSTKNYYLTEKDDNNGSSIVSQIENKLGSKEYIDYIRFSSTTSSYGDLSASTRNDYYYENRSSSRYDLEDVYFTPSTSRTGTASFDCTVYTTKDNYYYCTINIKVVSDGKSSGDIEYKAKAGAEVDFSRRDFEDWWEDNYSRGELDYVEFTSTSSGTLYADYSGSKGTNVVSSRNPESCYASPSRSQTGIDDLTFVPSNNSTSTVTIKFTAYGTTNSSSSNRSLNGTVTINYSGTTSSTTAKDISYSTTGTKGVSLSASDFTSRYRDVIGSSASTLTIRFTSVPSSGTLTYEPSSGRDVTLTSSNIKSYDFSSSSSGTYRISDVVYTPKNNTNISSDKVKYDCYSGSRLRFSGTIVFSSTATNTVTNNVTVSYSTTGASVAFNAADFYNKNSAMLSASYLTFGTPSSGTLYAGSAVATTGTKYGYVANAGYQHIANLSYRPAAGYNGTATISFTAYNSDGTQAATGTVNILVASSTTTNPTTPTTPTTPANTFSDVPNTPSTSWYYNEVAALAAAGIVAGRNDGQFHPNDAVNYGEALKLILLAAGHPQQTELSGAVWANNYLNYAITNSILSGSASDYTLSKSITRDAVAEIAAKALKLTPVTGGTSPYADSTNGYVLALTNAGIVQGDASSGTPRWRGTDTLTRAEISKIVYNVYKYRNVAPGGSSTTTPTVDTEVPGWLKS